MWHTWETRGKCTGFRLESVRRKKPLVRSRRKWEVWIRMDLREIGWGSVEWIQLAQNRDRWQVTNLRVLAPRS
jgi:hypothetical protein